MNDINVSAIDLENIRSIADDIISSYCDRHNVNEYDIPPAIWNDIIDELNDIIFSRNTQLLKDIPAINNSYNMEKVLFVYKLYKRLCNSHCQEVTLKGFIDLTGIDKQTIYNWSERASTIGFDLHEKIMLDNEQSLEAMLHDKRINPMKVLPSLNRKHNWNLPGVSREATPKKALTVDQLPQLGPVNDQAVMQIAQVENDET